MAWEGAYTADYRDLLLRLKEMITGYPLITTPVRSGDGDGIIYGIHTASDATVETWTITCTDVNVPATFSVVGSVSGAQGTATVDTLYSNSELSFTLKAGSVPFSAGDSFVFSVVTNDLVGLAQTWIVERWIGNGAKVVNYLASSVYDGSANYIPDKAVDESSSTTWASDNALGNGSWWQVEFDLPVDIREVTIGGFDNGSLRSSNSAPKNFDIQYSDDGSSWTTDTSVTDSTGWLNQTRVFPLTGTAGAHLFWRISITNVVSGTQASLPNVVMKTVDSLFNVAYYGYGYDAVFHGPGTPGGDDIFVSLRPDAAVIHGPNWVLGGSLSFAAGLDSFNQPGGDINGYCDASSTRPFAEQNRLTLYDLPFKYWITVSGRVIKVATRFQNICELSYLGYLIQYAIPAQYPYPCLIAGTQSAGGRSPYTTYHWTRTDYGHACIVNPAAMYEYPPDSYEDVSFPCRLYTPFNEWRPVGNKASNINTSSEFHISGSHILNVWPYQTDDGESYNYRLRDQLDGQVPLTPIVLIDKRSKSQYGELDGVMAVPGIKAIESLIEKDGEYWIVLNNVFRESANSFFALRLT